MNTSAWDRNAPDYAQNLLDQPEPVMYKNMLDRISMEHKKGMKILEVGCAGGNSFLHLSKRKPINGYTGLDITKSYIDLAKKRFPKVKWVVGDARAMPFKDKEFDTSFAMQLLLHLEREGARKVLEEMCRVTKSLVFVYTFAGLDRWESMRGDFLYNVMSVKEMEVPGWELDIMTTDGMYFIADHVSYLSHIPLEEQIFYEFVLRRVEKD